MFTKWQLISVWLAVFVLSGAVSYWYASRNLSPIATVTPVMEVAEPLPARDCGHVLAPLPDSDTLEVAQRGNIVTVEVRNKGGLRGTLLRMDLKTLIATVERRPPVGWRIGGGE